MSADIDKEREAAISWAEIEYRNDDEFSTRDLDFVIAGWQARAAIPPAPAEHKPDTSQEWAKLDGASAYHLIERHGEDWADIGNMMESWFQARMVALSGKGDAAIDWIGGVLSYDTRGHNKPCGQTIGANGAGEFIIIYRGTPDQASEAAHAHIRALEASGHRFNNVTFVQSGDAYYGPAIKVIATPQTTPSQAKIEGDAK